MHVNCPHCEKNPNFVSDCRTIRRHGTYYRTSDSRSIKRYTCLTCKTTFSDASKDPCFGQKKRQKNRKLLELLASGVSERRSAKLLRIDRKTVARKVIFLGLNCSFKNFVQNAAEKIEALEFDDMETFEHTKYKPLSVVLAVAKSRRILGFRVARMVAKGVLSKKSLKLYGKLPEERASKRKELFQEIRPIVQPGAVIMSDSNPYYVQDVKRFFPDCTHIAVKGARGAITGQGEIKKTGFDPIFALNHTCAMYRANVCNLIRKTWCTTKKKDRLAHRLAIYAYYHNNELIAA